MAIGVGINEHDLLGVCMNLWYVCCCKLYDYETCVLVIVQLLCTSVDAMALFDPS